MVYKSRSEFVISKINNYKNSDLRYKYLDIGFIGEYTSPFMHYKILNTLSKNDSLLGIDINSKIENIKNDEIINQYLSQVSYKKESIFEFNKQGFDIVTFLEVFEHLPHPYLSLHSIYNSMNKNGIFIMTYPNPLNIGIFYRYIFQTNILNKKFLNLYKGADDHKIFPLPPSLVIYLQELGFKVIEIAYIKGKFGSIPYLNKFSDYIGIVAIKK